MIPPTTGTTTAHGPSGVPAGELSANEARW